jgi:hypothetical protein
MTSTEKELEKKLLSKSNQVKRSVSDLKSYRAEEREQSAALATITDVYQRKQQAEALRETQQMIPKSLTMLRNATGELCALLEAKEFELFRESATYKAACEQRLAAMTELQSSATTSASSS